MKTRNKILVASSVSAILFFGAYQSFMYQCGTIPVFAETPRNPNFWNCLTAYQNPDYVDLNNEHSIHVDTDKQEYGTNDVIVVSGHVDKIVPNMLLTLLVHDPLMDVVSFSQVKINDDGTFVESLSVEGKLWEQNGIYKISAKYGNAEDQKDTLYLSNLESDDLL